LTILSHHQPQEPSDDISKIVRIDYSRVERMQEAIRAQEHWKGDERFRQFYLPVGRIVAYDDKNLPILNDIDDARTQLGMKTRKRLGKSILEEFYGYTKAPDGLTFVYNEDDGLVEWGGCMRAMREDVEKRKALAIKEPQGQQLVKNRRPINAVTQANNTAIEPVYSNIILAAGRCISQVLDRSGIEQPPEPRAPVATGIFAFILQLQEDQIESFRGKPSFSHIGYGMTPRFPLR